MFLKEIKETTSLEITSDLTELNQATTFYMKNYLFQSK